MNIDIGSKIKTLRLSKSMTQEQLAKALHVSAQAVSKWENGSSLPDIQLLPALSVTLGTSIDSLFSLTDESRFARIDNMLWDKRFLTQQEYLWLLNLTGKLPLHIKKMGTWIGKTGNIDIIAQNEVRENLVGLCNWEKPQVTMEMCEELFANMKKAKISANYYFLFSASTFEQAVVEMAEQDKRFVLIDMSEL